VSLQLDQRYSRIDHSDREGSITCLIWELSIGEPPREVKKMKLIYVILAVLAALLVFAIKFLPWWASLSLLLVGVLAVRWGVQHLLRRILIIPFKMKGKVLANAVVDVHHIEPAPMPLQESDEEESDYQQLAWHYVDVTISPTQQTEGFAAWEPSELILVPTHAKAEDLESGYDSEVCIIHDFKVYTDALFTKDEYGKYEGTQRLRLHMGVQPNTRQFKFRYYFELFGLITIPA
jgi:hypothetical protein